MSIEGTESVFVIRRWVSRLEARGLVLDEGPTARDPAFSSRLAIGRALSLRERALREFGPELPLSIAGSIDQHDCLFHFAAAACETVADVVDLTVTRWGYITDAFPVRKVRGPGFVRIEIDLPPEAPLGVRVGLEYLLAVIVRASGEMTGGAWRPEAVVLGHRPPVAISAWEQVCGTSVHLGDRSALIIDERSLALPVNAGVPRGTRQFLCNLLDQYTPHVAAQLTGRVVEALSRDLAAPPPTVERLAIGLGISARTLHRQLAAEGTSYQRVLDDLRCSEAVRQAADPGRPFKAIAAAVGFGDPRAFRRAFKRWTGTSPQQFRQRRSAGGSGAS